MPIHLDVIARYPLAPLLIWQGLRLRRTALVLPEADGARDGQCGHGPMRRILIVGDSSAAGVGVAHQDDALAGQVTKVLSQHASVTWRLIAQTGATTKSTLRDLSRHEPQSFDTVLVALGVNDVTHATSLRRFLKDQSALCTVLRNRFCATHIVLTAMPPLGRFPALSALLKWILGAQAKRFDAALRGWIETQPDCSYLALDIPPEPEMMARDGFHPSAATYAIWAKTAAALITVRWSDQ